MLYNEQELQALKAQLKKRWTCILVPVGLLLAGIIAVLVIRGNAGMADGQAQIIVDVMTILVGILLIGGGGLFIKPLRCYQRHLEHMLHDRTHVYDEGTFCHLDEDVSMVQGVAFYAMTLHSIDAKQKSYERLFYYDALKPLPSFKDGDPLRVVYHDRFIAQVELKA